MLQITNAGAEITASNYWQSEFGRNGLFYLSINAGAFRLLLPDAHKGVVSEFETAKEAESRPQRPRLATAPLGLRSFLLCPPIVRAKGGGLNMNA